MLLTELDRADPVPATAYGIEVDYPLTVPPAGLREASVLHREDASGGTDPDVVDVAVGFDAADVRTILEVPAAAPLADVGRLVGLATLTGLNVALLPPAADAGRAARDAYIDRVGQAARAFAAQANLASDILPVTSAFGVLVARHLDPATTVGMAVEGGYEGERMAGLDAEAVVAAVRGAFAERYGEAGFREFLGDLVGGVYADVRDTLVADARSRAAAAA